MPPLSDQELQQLSLQEGDRIERKRSASDLDKIREAVCAYANDLPDYRLPGIVFVGMEDNGGCAGLSVDDELLKRLASIRDDGNITPFPSMTVRSVTLNGCPLAVIEVRPSDNPPVRCRGRAWIRVGPRRAIATPEEERRLVEKRRWANLPFDAQPVIGTTIGDLDINRFRLEYLPSLVSVDTIEQNQRTVEQQLRALRLVDNNDVPTTTAILMIGKNPQTWFPGAFIAWRRVAGTALTDATQDEKTLTGTIPDQLRRLDEILESVISSSIAMGPHKHTRSADYPLAGLQQIVRNAAMHRAYEGTAAPVRVTCYSDRIEMLSPGGPFGSVTAATFGRPGYTDYRNPTLAEALKGYGFVERFGQGIEIARSALLANGNPPLEFALEPEEAPSWVLATVRNKS